MRQHPGLAAARYRIAEATARLHGAGLRPNPELEVEGPVESAAAIRDVLAGHAGPRRDVVVLNAAAVLWAAGQAAHLPSARTIAERAIDTGAAAELLRQFCDLSHASLP